MSAVLKHYDTDNPTRKLVLLSLADAANSSGICWPSITTIARYSCVSTRHVRDMLRDLESSGLIYTLPRFKDNRQTSNMYIMLIGIDEATLLDACMEAGLPISSLHESQRPKIWQGEEPQFLPPMNHSSGGGGTAVPGDPEPGFLQNHNITTSEPPLQSTLLSTEVGETNTQEEVQVHKTPEHIYKVQKHWTPPAGFYDKTPVVEEEESKLPTFGEPEYVRPRQRGEKIRGATPFQSDVLRVCKRKYFDDATQQAQFNGIDRRTELQVHDEDYIPKQYVTEKITWAREKNKAGSVVALQGLLNAISNPDNLTKWRNYQAARKEKSNGR